MTRGLAAAGTLTVLLCAAGAAAEKPAVPIPTSPTPLPSLGLSTRPVSYRIDASLDPERRLVSGTETVTYRNDSSDSLLEIPFHLYPNAFSSDRTLFAREWRREGETPPPLAGALREKGWGWMFIRSVGVEGGPDLSASARIEETVMRVPLPEPLAPGASVSLRIVWETKLPRVMARMGAWGDHFLVMQWFPKPGVYRNGAWNVHPFHAETEFFSDFASFDVSLTVPERFLVEATGIPGAEKRAGGSRTVLYHAEDVHDFAWVADPRARTVREKEGGVEIVFFHQPGHEAMAPRILATVRRCLKLYGEWYSPYPYNRIVVVDLPMGLGGGMEYPMLFTTFMTSFLPDYYLGPESVTAHEFGHQIWYGLVATNEFEEAWLDEGINTYTTLRLMEATILKPWAGETLPALFHFAFFRALGRGIPLDLGFHQFNLVDLVGFRRSPFQESSPGTLLGYPVNPFNLNLPGLTTGYLAGRREAFLRDGTEDPLETASWDFYPGAYHDTVYSKATLVLKTLEGRIGTERMSRLLREYAGRHRFSHPTAEDFLSVAGEVSGMDLRSFADQLIFGSARVDFAVGPVRSERVRLPEGYLLPERPGEAPRESRGMEAPGGQYLSEVVVRRLGDAALPVDVLVTFEDGSSVRETWDASTRWRRYSYTRASRLASVVIDPERIYQVDLNFNNNSHTLRHQGAAVGKLSAIWLFWLQNYLHLVSTLS